MVQTERSMSSMVVACILLVAVGCEPEERALRQSAWSDRADAGQLTSGQVVVDEATGEEVLTVTHPGGGPAVLPLTVIDDPGISAGVYGVRGRVRYEDVSGAGYLEMWSYFPDGSSFFSRTLDTGGAMQQVSGNSPWRNFTLPGDIRGVPGDPKPNRLVVNLILPESGTVWITDLEVVEWDGFPDLDVTAGAWWGGRTGGMIGGGFGGGMGILLGLCGTLIGIGRMRGFVTAVLVVTAAFGVASLIMGLVALADGQPYAVTYPLLLIGALGLFFGIGGLPISRMSYRQRELRQMQALDA